MKSSTFFTATSNSKKASSFLVAFFLMTGTFAGIIITPATSSVNISADKAANAATPGFTPLSDIMFSEAKASDFANTLGISKTFILTAPAGWVFNTAAGHISANAAKDFRAVSMTVKTTTITIHFIVAGTANIDMLKISGIEVKATNGAILPCLGQIHIAANNPGTANFHGLKATNNRDGQGSTNFGMMSQVPGIPASLAFINRPDSSVAGIAFDKQPVIITQDQFGNPTTNGLSEIQPVKVKLSSGSGSLDGSVTLNIGTAGGNGMVSFSDISVSEAGAKKLMAVSGSLTFAVTNEFIVTDQNTTTTDVSSDDYNPDWIASLENKNNNFLAI